VVDLLVDDDARPDASRNRDVEDVAVLDGGAEQRFGQARGGRVALVNMIFTGAQNLLQFAE
jgi:hypothetical protein